MWDGSYNNVTDFYPRSPCGERLTPCAALTPELYFYPRSPCGERLGCRDTAEELRGFLSTLSLRRATSARSVCFAW